jgi:hypothetical protein
MDKLEDLMEDHNDIKHYGRDITDIENAEMSLDDLLNN